MPGLVNYLNCLRLSHTWPACAERGRQALRAAAGGDTDFSPRARSGL